MKAEQQPGFFFFFDWLDDCADQSAETQIEFVRAIAHYAQTGEKPEKLSPIVSLLTRSVFREVDLQKRKREQIRERRQAAGRAGNAKRWGESQNIAKIANATNASKESQTSLNQDLNQDQDLNLNQDKKTSATADEKKVAVATKPTRIEIKKALRRIFDAYPPQGQAGGIRIDAESAFIRDFAPELEETILESIERWKASEEWQQDGGKWIPSFTTFITDEKWRAKPCGNVKRFEVSRNAPKRPGMIDTSGDYYAREKERMKQAGFDVVD